MRIYIARTGEREWKTETAFVENASIRLKRNV